MRKSSRKPGVEIVKKNEQSTTMLDPYNEKTSPKREQKLPVNRTKKVPLPFMVEQARDMYIDELQNGLHRMFAQADNFFFNLTGKGYNNASFEAMRTLRVKKDELISQFVLLMQHAFKQKLELSVGKTNLSQTDDELFSEDYQDLTLLENHTLEENIAIEQMVKKAVVVNSEAIGCIRARLESLLANCNISEKNSPFEPMVICENFRQAALVLYMEMEQLLVIYKFFEGTLLTDLNGIYEKINQYFIDKHVLPKYKIPVAKNIPQPKKRPDTPQATKLSPEQIHQSQQQRQELCQELSQQHAIQRQDISDNQMTDVKALLDNQDLVNLMRELLPQNINTAHHNAVNQVEHQSLDTTQLIDSLNQLQNNPGPVPATDSGSQPNLKQQLSQNLKVKGHPHSSIGHFENDMIDIVSMLFDFILDDRQLHPEIKAVISRLQIPILKVCLVDKSFFSNKKHPAKLLLNEMANAGVSWEPENNDAQLVLDEINQITQKISAEFNQDIQLLADILIDFRKFVRNYQRKIEIFERRTRQSEEGKVKTEASQLTVNQELQRICNRQKLPASVKTILKQVWSHVMLLKRLKNSDHGWSQACEVARILIWSVQPKSDEEELKKLMSYVPALIKNLKKGFTITAVAPNEEAQMLAELEATHREVIQTSKDLIEATKIRAKLKSDLIRLAPAPVVNNPQLRTAIDQQKQARQQERAKSNIIEITDIGFTVASRHLYDQNRSIDDLLPQSLQKVKKLELGQWADVFIDNKKHRCKIATIISTGDKFVLVNRNGNKLADFTTEELAYKLQSKEFVPFATAPLFDRALESVVVSLKSIKSVIYHAKEPEVPA